MSKPEVEVRQVSIAKTEWDPELPEEAGSYANFMQISFNQNEFVLAFGQVADIDMETGIQKCKLVSKVLVPHHLVPDILRAVEENLAKFTELFGQPEAPQPKSRHERPTKRKAG